MTRTATRHTLLLQGMHCPSCVRHVETILEAGGLHDVAVSLFAGTVSFAHADERDLKPLVRELRDAGFVAVEPEHSSAAGEALGPAPDAQSHPHSSRPLALKWLEAVGPAKRHRRKRHREVCAACRTEDAALQDEAPALVTVAPAPAAAKWTRTALSIGGMTCGSCVGSLRDGLRDDAIRQAEVTLMPGRAVVEHDTSRLGVEQLRLLVEDLGYDAALESSVDLAEQSDRWRVKLAVSGMTCASCTGAVKTALGHVAHAADIEVELMNGLASLTLDDEAAAAAARSEVEDAGFDCDVVEVRPLSAATSPAAGQPRSRTVRMRVDGMFCQCVLACGLTDRLTGPTANASARSIPSSTP
jgi:Cu+-exporting ATPase